MDHQAVQYVQILHFAHLNYTTNFQENTELEVNGGLTVQP